MEQISVNELLGNPLLMETFKALNRIIETALKCRLNAREIEQVLFETRFEPHLIKRALKEKGFTVLTINGMPQITGLPENYRPEREHFFNPAKHSILTRGAVMPGD